MNEHIGIDFGTTNSAIACRNAVGETKVAQFDLHGAATASFRSLLFFEAERDLVRGRPPAWIGPDAIKHYIAGTGEGRLMQSMKTFLSSKHVKATSVFGADFRLEDLIAMVVRTAWEKAFPDAKDARPPITAGRPVRFAGADSDAEDNYAEARLRVAFRAAGFDDVTFVPEPVAAALHYESMTDRDEVVLVGDFGGGTSDFCLLHVGPSYAGTVDRDARVIGISGVGVAGDNLDARLINHLIAPHLGLNTTYRTLTGKNLPIPPWIFRRIERWNELSVLKSRKNFLMLMKFHQTAADPKQLEALLHLIEENQGYRMSQAVEATKIALSGSETAEVRFMDGPIDIQATVTRAEFDGWIAPELAALSRCVDGLLKRTGTDPAKVDAVFLTGGTALVPAVRSLFDTRFGADRIRTGDFLGSVASGLASYGA